ncbi:MAG: hypothetical protein IKH78_07385 [Ruminococcus sp.]|nr:hypothetical protein [Ruminococcus sp.]
MKKIICLSTALLCMLSAFAGCGDTSKEKTSSATSSVSDTTTDADTATTDTAGTTEAATTGKKENGKTGSTAEAADFIGKWQCDEIIADGKSSDNLLGVDAYALYQLELNEDGTGTLFSFLYSGFLGDDEPLRLTWEAEGSDSVNVTIDESQFEGFAADDDDDDFSVETETETMKLRKDGDRLVIAEDEEDTGFMIYLSKVDKFTPIPEDMEMSLDFGGEFATDFEFSDEDFGSASKAE